VKRKPPELVMLNPEDFFVDRSGAVCPAPPGPVRYRIQKAKSEQVEKDNDLLGVDPRNFLNTSMREARERL
jgi:hypothetical protein